MLLYVIVGISSYAHGCFGSCLRAPPWVIVLFVLQAPLVMSFGHPAIGDCVSQLWLFLTKVSLTLERRQELKQIRGPFSSFKLLVLSNPFMKLPDSVPWGRGSKCLQRCYPLLSAPFTAWTTVIPYSFKSISDPRSPCCPILPSLLS